MKKLIVRILCILISIGIYVIIRIMITSQPLDSYIIMSLSPIGGYSEVYYFDIKINGTLYVSCGDRNINNKTNDIRKRDYMSKNVTKTEKELTESELTHIKALVADAYKCKQSIYNDCREGGRELRIKLKDKIFGFYEYRFHKEDYEGDDGRLRALYEEIKRLSPIKIKSGAHLI